MYKKEKHWKRGLITIGQDPKRFFKDVVGEKKSVFARSLWSVKKMLEMEKRRKTRSFKKETRNMEKDGSKRVHSIVESTENGSHKKLVYTII